MNIFKISLLLISILMLGSQCKTKKSNANNKTSQEKVEDKNGEEKFEHITTTEIVDGEFDLESSDPLTIKSTKIEGNMLKITVSHSGGCGAHKFTLYGSRNIQKSLPPIRGLFLHHDLNGDNCRALIEHELSFDISDFAYRQMQGSEINLRLERLKGDILYQYQE